ncbi:hypothetical protein ACI65C_002570 [Semiaphis heraclei]
MNRKYKKRIEYARRLKELKEKLKPYRDRHTVNLLRVITGSSGVNLDNYWENLESVLTGEYSHSAVKERIQSVVNMILQNGELAKSKAILTRSSLDNKFDIKFQNLQIDMKTNMFDTLRHSNINSRPNMFHNVGHSSNNSRANEFDTVRHSNIDPNANVLNNERHVNIDSKANVLNNERHSNVDRNTNMLNNLRHVEIDSKANVFNNVRNDNIDLKEIVINKVRHLHIDGCNPECYSEI